jgi:hypothetical protein
MADEKTGKPNHIEDWICRQHTGTWFTWTDSKNKVYDNLRLADKIGIEGEPVDNPYSLPTEQECIDGLAQLQTDFDNEKTKKETDSSSGNQKLKDLGLTDDEIKALTGK